ncbi:HipA domain-containing protein [Thioalkalivibrio sp. ALMg9]|uniref:HipA domain-containing protein n=1 Tax=Thioalkalivibrio sp. ALMg9 TaxID=1266912 RepID=UPI0012DE3B1F|nr:HipA domain-containing protein [Thioalkalivibrio sp. ALMg9]
MFTVIDIEADWALDDEPMGSKDKFWVDRPDDSLPWLFKFSRVNDGEETGEHWSEKLAAEIAQRLGIQHAPVELARFGDSWGSLSRMFETLADEAVELVHGNELLAGEIPAYDPERRYKQNQHTLENILHAVQHGIQGNESRLAEAYHQIGGYLVLDALILNTDRHHENWALFRRTKGDNSIEHWIAPSFDHASSLGRELTRSMLIDWQNDTTIDRVAWYAKRGRGGVFRNTGDRRGANPLQLAELAQRTWPQFIDPWLKRLRDVGREAITAPLERVPPDCMTEAHRWFARNLLEHTYSRLVR